MGIAKPYKRTVRIFTDGSYADSGKGQYVRHKDYAESPKTFIQAFLLIQKDVLDLFNYIEPSDTNQKTYSHRIHELLLRTCVEVEANCTAILRENGYTRSGGDWNMGDYKKIEQSHYISQYEVKIPNWSGSFSVRKPFDAWASGAPLSWYQSYNHTKHDRHQNFQEANFENLLDAACGLAALMASQFLANDFSPITTWIDKDPTDPFQLSIGHFFEIKYPTSVPANEQYDFENGDIDFNTNIFQVFPYR